MRPVHCSTQVLSKLFALPAFAGCAIFGEYVTMKMQRLLGLGAGLALAVSSGFAAAAASKSVEIGYVDGWADSVATTNVAAVVIKEKLGVDVKLTAVATGIMWQGVATGKLDATLSAWLPVTHGEYWEKNKDKVVDLGPNFKDAKIGLIVPEYVKAKSIGDLQADKDAYKATIVGIDAGSGVMLKTDQAIKDYGLDFKLQASSGAAMTTALGKAEAKQESIVVTGWIPHWMFAKWKLRFLDDPKGVYGAAEHVDNVVSKDLETKAPTVTAFLKKFNWTSEEIGSVMLDIQNGAKPAAAAEKWVKAHPDRVKEWTQ